MTRSSDVRARGISYDEGMPRVYLADTLTDERTALRLMLTDLDMTVVGEAADWATLFTEAPGSGLDMLVVDYDLLPGGDNGALAGLRAIFPTEVIVVLISRLDARHQAALSIGADAFISKGETPDRIATRLKAAARKIVI